MLAQRHTILEFPVRIHIRHPSRCHRDTELGEGLLLAPWLPGLIEELLDNKDRFQVSAKFLLIDSERSICRSQPRRFGLDPPLDAPNNVDAVLHLALELVVELGLTALKIILGRHQCRRSAKCFLKRGNEFGPQQVFRCPILPGETKKGVFVSRKFKSGSRRDKSVNLIEEDE